MLCDTLLEVLDPRSGAIQQLDTQETNHWQIAFDIAWKGNIHFIIVTASFREGYGHYYVVRDDQLVSPTYFFNKLSDELFIRMQRLIDEIESGKYRNKKTLSEKIVSAVEQKGLTSYMNNTKWRELLSAVKEKIPDISLQYKTIFEDDAQAEYWNLCGDEDIGHMDLAQLEWLRLRHIITETIYKGALLSPEVRKKDIKDELLQILHKYNIPYEYDENEQAFVVYGYKK